MRGEGIMSDQSGCLCSLGTELTAAQYHTEQSELTTVTALLSNSPKHTGKKTLNFTFLRSSVVRATQILWDL